MRENLSNSSYYALVWKDSLDKKGKIKGELITKTLFCRMTLEYFMGQMTMI